jgi:LPPG:FO 2-phospho-L-lactate transferase
MLDVVGAEDLVVIANTGDDLEIYGAYVSPDPDLVTFWLADQIDARGWGLREDTFEVMEGMRSLGVDIWFNLGDRDLAIGLERARLLSNGMSFTTAHAMISSALGVGTRVLPMSEQPVRTRVLAHGRWWPFQAFMMRARAEGPVDEVEFAGARAAAATPEALEALANAKAILIGPSNPVISIGPILAVDGLREAVRESQAPVIAVSPVVRGEVLKPATAPLMRWAGHELSSTGIARFYSGLLDGLVADEPTDQLPVLETDMLMADADGRRRLAEQALAFALRLG